MCIQPQKRKDAKIADKASGIVRLMLASAFLLLAGCKQEETKSTPAPDELTVTHSMQTNAVHVGDQIELMITAYYPTNGTLQLPALEQGKELMVLNRDWNDTPREDGLTRTDVRFTLTSFRLGKHLLSTNPITCQLNNDTILTAEFPNALLHVESVLTNDSLEISDIKPLHKLPSRFPRWIWVVLLVAFIAFLIGLLVSKLWKQRELPKPAPPPLPAHIIAFRALEALQNRGWLEEDLCEPFYTELSLILREYLDGRFHLNAPDSTTEEIVEQMSSSPELSGKQQNILKEFMRQADMVKFAKGHPDRNTMEAAYATTQHFVDETKTTGEAVPPIGNLKSEI